MYFNQVGGYDPSKTSTYNFYGINRTRRTSKGEFSSMRNMSTIEYPCAAPSGRLRMIAKAPLSDDAPVAIQAVAPPDTTNITEITGFTGIAGGEFYYNGERKGFKTSIPDYWQELYTFPPTHNWEIIRKGNRYIFNGYNPDDRTSLMYWYNVDTDTFGDSTATMRNLIVNIEDTTYNGEAASIIWIGPYYVPIKTHRVTISSGKTIDCSTFYRQYAENKTYFTWGSGDVDYDDLIFSSRFKIGDHLTLSGFPNKADSEAGQAFMINRSDYSKITVGKSNFDHTPNNTIDAEDLHDTSQIGDHAIVDCVVRQYKGLTQNGVSWNYKIGIVVQCYNKNGGIETLYNIKGDSDNTLNWCCGITIAKKQRSFTNISMHQGRIWGVVPSGDQIFASASDQMFSFSNEDIYSGYAARLASDTPSVFTGLVPYNGSMVAFKESTITVITGDNPSNYYSYDISGIGCIDAKSIAVTPSGIIFLSYNGFYIFSGNVAQMLSAKLNTPYLSAVAGYDGNIYYASCVKEDGSREMVSYDLRHSVWHVLDDKTVTGLYTWRGKRYICDNIFIYEWENEADDSVLWEFTSVRTHLNTLDKKAMSEAWIRCEMGEGSQFKIETRSDGGRWREHSEYKDMTGLQILRCPIRAEMGSTYEYRIKGRGMVVFYEIEIQQSFGGRDYKAQSGVTTNEAKIDIKRDFVY